LEDLIARIDSEAPNWRNEALRRTETFRQAGRYDESSGNWSRIKKVYMRLQHEKCAYCERRLSSEDAGGAIDHDVDHYRPKNGVRKWPTEEIANELNISYDFLTGEDFPEGYYLLAYNILNYATACKKCNSPLKNNFFPILGERGPQSEDPVALRREEPLLLYPISDLDEDPEEILGFNGINPNAKVTSGRLLQRATVTIHFFRLHIREDLLRERAELIEKLFIAFEALQDARGEDRTFVSEIIEHHLSPQSPHTNCARSFELLYRQDRDRATDFARAALQYLKDTRSPRNQNPPPPL
jgi:hypothetical protein